LIGDFLNRKIADHDPLLRGDGDEPLLLQALESRLDGSFAHSQFAGERTLGQKRAGRQIVVENAAAKLVIGPRFEQRIN
jgi:hypothetical protein